VADNKHIGSNFDDFLQEEGLLEEASGVALKRVVAWQLTQAMKAQRVSKSEMAERMRTSRSQLDRILGEGGGMTIETLGRAMDALGLRLRLDLVREPVKHPGRSRREPAPARKTLSRQASRGA
jgi:antitoxin HicB